MAKRGRKALPDSELRRRRDAWQRARRYSGLSAREIADLLGKSVATVYGYNAAGGNPAPVRDIELLREHALVHAISSLERKFDKPVVMLAA